MQYIICQYCHSAESGESDNREEVLLVAVLVPLLSVLLLVALLVPITVGGWRFWAKRCAHSFQFLPSNDNLWQNLGASLLDYLCAVRIIKYSPFLGV